VVNYGVTSIVIGDCGASCAPVPPKPGVTILYCQSVH